MAKLNQVIAVEKGIKNRVEKQVTDLYHTVQKPDLFGGFARQYQPTNDDGERFPAENKTVQQTVGAVVRDVKRALTELFDVTASKDYANCTARASVVVDGETVVENAPVTFLLFLEKQLTDLHTMASKLPTLDPAEKWDADKGSDLFRSDVVRTAKTKKVNKPIVLYDATDKHPAQTQLVQEDQTIGYWETTKMSGAISPPAQRLLVERIEKLQKAVKFAREQGNMVEAPEQAIGARVLGWIFK